VSRLLLEFFNLITDYAELSLDLERDEDCFHWWEPDFWSAMRLASLFGKRDSALRGKLTSAL
jgi:hypothetical protein